MPIRIVQLGSPRSADEGLRIGTVRRPPRGVPKAEFARRDYYDVRTQSCRPKSTRLQLALQSHQLQAQGQTAEADKLWKQFAAAISQAAGGPAPASRTLDLLAALSHQTAFALGCYCEDEARCHRSILRSLLAERGADFSIG